MTPKRMKHDYTNEIELKSLLIREKNSSLNNGTEDIEKNEELDSKIKEYIKTRDTDLKNYIISESEKVKISEKSHEYFGSIVILMIKKILTKPNFSGYSWQDEFYSDACYRVFKYLHNFNHTLKSKATGQDVSAFAYISQIIHNSIVAIINEKNKNKEALEELSKLHNMEFGITNDNSNKSTFLDTLDSSSVTHEIHENIVNEIKEYLKNDIQAKNIEFVYPKKLLLSYDDYAEIQKIIKEFRKEDKNISIIKNRNS